MSDIRLIVGLGNPGADYRYTRHNAGAWYVEALARRLGASLRSEKKYSGEMASLDINGRRLHLLIPTTFMNLSGQATSALANFFRIAPEEMLVCHDELDLPPGTIRLKEGGGHGGHNGLKDIVARHGNNSNFRRLRIGIGHPANGSRDVVAWVLGKPAPADQQKIDTAIDAALAETDALLAGEFQKVMSRLNGLKAD